MSNMYQNLWVQFLEKRDCYRNKPVAQFGNEELRFEDLRTRVEAISSYLVNITSKEVILIHAINPLDNIVGLLGVLAAGKTFWLTDSAVLEQLDPSITDRIFELQIEQTTELKPQVLPIASEIKKEHDPNHPFCWVKSSGEPLTPKITEHSYQSIIEDTFRQIEENIIQPSDRIDIAVSLNFSAVLSAIFPALLSGASLHMKLPSTGIADIYDFWKKERITVSTLLPSMMRALVKCGFDLKDLSLRFLCIGGERVILRDLYLFKENFAPQALLQVAMASSEARMIGQFRIGASETPSEEIIRDGIIRYAQVTGKSISILDDNGRSLGYGQLGRISITSNIIGSKYISSDDSFQKSAIGENIFVSDDIGMLNADGTFCLDESDRTRDYMGQTIDLDQLQMELQEDRRINDCELLFSESGDMLYIFAVSSHDRTVLSQWIISLFGHSSFRLVLLDDLPKVETGKVDFKVLFSIIDGDLEDSTRENSRELDQLWNYIFPSESNFSGKHFFNDLGGDSISAVELAEMIQRVYYQEIQPNVLHHYPVFEDLKEFLENGRTDEIKSLATHDASLPNVLVFPTIRGSYEWVNPIMAELSSQCNFFVIRYQSKPSGKFPSPYVIVKECVEFIRKSKLVFSCHLGYSFSGFLAYATAHLSGGLASVLMIDTPIYSLVPFKDWIRHYAIKIIKSSSFERLTLTKVNAGIHRVYKRLMAGQSKGVYPQEESLKNHSNTNDKDHDSFFNHIEIDGLRIPKSDLRLGVFYASDSTYFQKSIKPDYSWEKFTPNVLFKQELMGNHASVIPDNFKMIANSLLEISEVEIAYDK